ncbi:MAG: TonB-dependent receptor [Dysgonamonadaceae bacterium]|jgi:hypothetical protein|nr:TonB-dependent receptor [Dysgonamonadaceae bacterium]
MFYKSFITLCLFFTAQNAFCQYTLSGKTLDRKTGRPVEYASVTIADRELWAISNEKGEFIIRNVAPGDIQVAVSCLGYVKNVFRLKISGPATGLEFHLQEDNLALNEVVVTAKNKSDGMATSYLIDRAGLDHLQMTGIPDIAALLPGGQTNLNLHLAGSSPQRMTLRSVDSEDGNASFATAIEVDGVRLSGNASFLKEKDTAGKAIAGIDTRSIASGNVESVEVITGVPSVEFGDMSNGIVKIHTRKGKTPLEVDMATKPNTKQIAVNKGFGLSRNAGVLNASLEYTKSIADLASPYTSYVRNALALTYENTINKTHHRPLTLTFGASGNIGGYDNHSDPDRFLNDYTKESDNHLRSYLKLNWLLGQPWITNLEVQGAVNYTYNRYENNARKSSAASTAAVHTTDEGYFVAEEYREGPMQNIILIPAGYWDVLYAVDNRPIDFTVNTKAKWARKFGEWNNHVMLGADFHSTGNYGEGKTFDQLRYAASQWRAYRYREIPFMHVLSPYLEEKIAVPFGDNDGRNRSYRHQLQLVAGVRSDITMIRNSEYGTAAGFSPRFNAKYTWTSENESAGLQWMNIRVGWGKAVKLPSFEALYPRPEYADYSVFAGPTMADGTSFRAYYTLPFSTRYNPGLQWQYNVQQEVGFEAKIKGVFVSLSAYNNTTKNAYKESSIYEPFTYKYTAGNELADERNPFPIPPGDRIYSIDRTTGIVTVGDRNNAHAPISLSYKDRNTFRSTAMYYNGAPSVRRGVEWIIKTDKLPALQTSVQVDGSYYFYRSVETALLGYAPTGRNMSNGEPYKYMGFYEGGNNASNGSETRKLTTNATFTTHIPAVRFIVSLRIEGTLLHYTRRLSDFSDGSERGFVLDGKDDFLPSPNGGSIYERDRYVGLYPQYYVSWEDMNTPRNFAEDLAWAKTNNIPLYNDLTSLVVKSNTDYFFNPNRRSMYYSANISITKEISDIVSLSFNATNFFNTMQLVRQGDQDIDYSAYEISSGLAAIPRFYYGMSLRIKF